MTSEMSSCGFNDRSEQTITEQTSMELRTARDLMSLCPALFVKALEGQKSYTKRDRCIESKGLSTEEN